MPFTGVREKTPGLVGGVAIRFWNGEDGASRYVAEVRTTMIADCYTGIRIQGADEVISYEQGTLHCPFPDPVLKILSWPGIEDGFPVQSAPTQSGPWSTLDVKPTRQNGQNNVVVPAGSDQQFFRLVEPSLDSAALPQANCLPKMPFDPLTLCRPAGAP